MLELMFALCWLLILYHHLIYPWLLHYLGRQAEPVSLPATPDPLALPQVCILIPAFNEAGVIADKVRNVASLDYPPERLTLIIACDGCTDNTAEIALRTACEPENRALRLRVVQFQNNRGKVAVLNSLIPTLPGSIIALSDASALMAVDAISRAVGHLRDKRVGVVAATYRILTPGSAGEASYWRYQTVIKRGEAVLGAPVGVHGALYFFRKSLFQALPGDTINDDFILPMSIVSRGYQTLYDAELIALELETATAQMDSRRRIRIAAGNLQQLLRMPGLLHPRHRGTAFAFASGKALRALMPLLLALQFVLCALLALNSPWAQLGALLQAGAVLFSRCCLYLNWTPPLAHIVTYPINGYVSGFIGVMRYLTGQERGCWKPVTHKEAKP